MESLNPIESNNHGKILLGRGVSECQNCSEVILDETIGHCGFCKALFHTVEPKSYSDIIDLYEINVLRDYLKKGNIQFKINRELKIRAGFLLKKLILEDLDDCAYSLLFLELENILRDLKKNKVCVKDLILSIEKLPMNQAKKNCLNFLTFYKSNEVLNENSLKIRKLLISYFIFMVILAIFYFT